MSPEREVLIGAIYAAIWKTSGTYKDLAQAALAAIEAHGGGCTVSPNKPTDAMVEAALNSNAPTTFGELRDAIAASPYAPPSPTCNDHLQVGDLPEGAKLFTDYLAEQRRNPERAVAIDTARKELGLAPSSNDGRNKDCPRCTASKFTCDEHASSNDEKEEGR